MAHKTLIGGTSYEISGGKTLVGGTAYSISGGKTLVGGTAYEIGFGEKILGNLAVGRSVYMNVGGVPTEFLVVHQGLPDANLYDASCDGTWLLMKNIYQVATWQANNSNYGTSVTHSDYLNNVLFGKFDANVRSAIKEVKIPYVNGTSYSDAVAIKENGLASKLFLLSCGEVGLTPNMNSTFPADGACLDYFKGTAATDTKRIAYYNGTANAWFLRSPSTNMYMWNVSAGGGSGTTMFIMSSGMRPALILPKELAYDENFNVIA